MNWLDIVLILILGFFTLRSFSRGFAREIIRLVAAIAALVLGMWFYGRAGTYVARYLDSPRMADLAGFILVATAVLLLGSVVSWIVNRFLRTAGLSFFDRLLGAALGLARGLVVTIAFLTAFIAFGPHDGAEKTPSAMVHSKIAPYVLEASHAAVALAPAELKLTFRKYYSQLKTALQEAAGKPAEKDS